MQNVFCWLCIPEIKKHINPKVFANDKDADKGRMFSHNFYCIESWNICTKLLVL